MTDESSSLFDRSADLGQGWSARLIGSEARVKLIIRSPSGFYTHLSPEETENLRALLNAVLSPPDPL